MTVSPPGAKPSRHRVIPVGFRFGASRFTEKDRFGKDVDRWTEEQWLVKVLHVKHRQVIEWPLRLCAFSAPITPPEDKPHG